MEYIKCPNCSKETPKALSRCKHCGQRISKFDEMPESTELEPKERNGFVTFYLGMGLVCNSLLGIAYFITLFTSIGLWSAHDSMSSRIYGVVASIVLVVGYLMLLKWKKIGFYILAGMAVISIIMNLIFGEAGDLSIFSPVIGIMLLFAVLQIRKNGESCWAQLS